MPGGISVSLKKSAPFVMRNFCTKEQLRLTWCDFTVTSGSIRVSFVAPSSFIKGTTVDTSQNMKKIRQKFIGKRTLLSYRPVDKVQMWPDNCQ